MSHDAWDPHRAERIEMCLRWSHAERLQWLERAKRFAAVALGAAARNARRSDDPEPTD